MKPKLPLRVLAVVFPGVFTIGPVAGQTTLEWRLAPPEFEVGGVEADQEYTLSVLGGVTLLPNGNVVVGDRSAPFLKVFGPDGTFLRAVGRYGSGPGEYEHVYDFDWCAAGELTVFDVDRRIHRYEGDLERVSTELVSFEALGGGPAYKHDCHPNGFQIVTGWGDVLSQVTPGLFEATAPVVLLAGQETVRDFGERLSSQRLGTTRADGSPSGSGPHPFGRATVVALGSAYVYVGAADSYEIEVYDLSGAPQPSLRWDGPSLEYDDNLLEALKEAALADAPERSRPRLRRWYASIPELKQIPAYDRILVSDSDEVWVRQFFTPGSDGEEWVVFGRDHALSGRLTLPARSTLWEVRDDRVVYSILDDFDVPIVRISQIER